MLGEIAKRKNNVLAKVRQHGIFASPAISGNKRQTTQSLKHTPMLIQTASDQALVRTLSENNVLATVCQHGIFASPSSSEKQKADNAKPRAHTRLIQTANNRTLVRSLSEKNVLAKVCQYGIFAPPSSSESRKQTKQSVRRTQDSYRLQVINPWRDR